MGFYVYSTVNNKTLTDRWDFMFTLLYTTEQLINHREIMYTVLYTVKHLTNHWEFGGSLHIDIHHIIHIQAHTEAHKSH